jgi:hypothetical protein
MAPGFHCLGLTVAIPGKASFTFHLARQVVGETIGAGTRSTNGLMGDVERGFWGRSSDFLTGIGAKPR